MSSIASFVKYQRKQQHLTQLELATKAGVGLRFIRDLEQGKDTLQLNKVQQVLDMFGFKLAPVRQSLDAYHINQNYFNKAVKITLHTKIVKYGIFIETIKDNKEIVAWQFVPNKNAWAYQQKPDRALTEIIQHKDIQSIENQ